MSLINDISRVSVARIPAPPAGRTVVDSTFGTIIHRVTDSAKEGIAGAGVVPIYTGTQAWNADESLMVVYEQKRGLRLHRGQPPFEFLSYVELIEHINQVEAFHWSTTKPYEFTYLSASGKLIHYDILSRQWTTRWQFPEKHPTQNILTESHVRPSWDDKRWGVTYWTDAARSDKRLVVVDLEAGDELLNIGYQDIGGLPATDKGTIGIPMVSPDGERCLIFVQGRFHVVNLTTRKAERILPADWTFEHQAFGKIALPDLGFEADVYYSKTQGKNVLGTIPAMMMTCNIESGYERPDLGLVVANHRLDWPYRKLADGTFSTPFPTGIHHTAIAYRDPNWVWSSMMPPAKQGYVYGGGTLAPFEQEIWRTNIAKDTNIVGSTLERVCHHRSAALAMNNIHEYYQEPHPCVSPSGRFCLFGSDWSFDLPPGERATKIDSWVVELNDNNDNMEGVDSGRLREKKPASEQSVEP